MGFIPTQIYDHICGTFLQPREINWEITRTVEVELKCYWRRDHTTPLWEIWKTYYRPHTTNMPWFGSWPTNHNSQQARPTRMGGKRCKFWNSFIQNDKPKSWQTKQEYPNRTVLGLYHSYGYNIIPTCTSEYYNKRLDGNNCVATIKTYLEESGGVGRS